MEAALAGSWEGERHAVPDDPEIRALMVVSRWEETLAQQIRAAKLPEPEREYRFHNARRWRFDFAFLPDRIAVEVEGGVWARGRHSRGGGFEADASKYNAAALAGWRLFRFTPAMVQSGEALRVLEEALR